MGRTQYFRQPQLESANQGGAVCQPPVLECNRQQLRVFGQIRHDGPSHVDWIHRARSPIGLAGTPITVESGATSRTTHAPAPITARRPMRSGLSEVPFFTVAPTPIQTCSAISTLPAIAARGATIEPSPILTLCETMQPKLRMTFAPISQASDTTVPAKI